jgi:drug/metabolite transporter (DMT)-like permease
MARFACSLIIEQVAAIERRMGAQGAGALLGLTATLMWGSQFPVAKSLFHSLDPYTLTTLRYGVAALAFIGVLALVEGPRALRFDGYLGRASWYGTLGITGGVLLVYVGLQHTTAIDAALVLSLQPVLTALVLRFRGQGRVSPATLATMALAFVGAMLVISRGNPVSIVTGQVGWGILLVIVGQIGWVLYTIEATSFRGWSPLRFTALTALPATLVIVLLSGLADAAGWAHPSGHSITGSPWLLLYAIVGPATIAVLAWNLGRARLGAQNIALFQNLVPITTFAITIGQGYRPGAVEVAGAALTIGALAANNVLTRHAQGVACDAAGGRGGRRRGRLDPSCRVAPDPTLCSERIDA